MADTRKTRYNAQGEQENLGYDPEKTKDQLEDNAAAARFGTTAGADLGGVAARARAAKPAVEETDESKMSPLALAAYRAKKKKPTTDDAANALASR